MKVLRMSALVFSLLGFAFGNATAQSRKEAVEKMTVQIDSLQKLLAAKTENFQQMEVKLARLQGTVDANNGIVKLLQNKSDSLILLLNSRKNIVDSLNNELSKLNTVITYLKSEGKTLSSKNEVLQQELDALKPKAPVSNVAAEAKPIKKETVEKKPETNTAKVSETTSKTEVKAEEIPQTEVVKKTDK